MTDSGKMKTTIDEKGKEGDEPKIVGLTRRRNCGDEEEHEEGEGGVPRVGASHQERWRRREGVAAELLARE